MKRQMKIEHKVKHPAKYSDVLLEALDALLPDDSYRILDPFAGTGKLRMIRPSCVLLEIEPEWASLQGAIVGDATVMPFKNASFDVVCTSPTYGNRMADHFEDCQVQKNYKRNTYRHALGRALSDNNSGKMQWGHQYKTLHQKAWMEVFRVLKHDGKFILNISDHIRQGQIIPVTQGHVDCITATGFGIEQHEKIKTKRQRFGQNHHLRVDYESLIVFTKFLS